MTSINASRTLLKSPPELWSECSDAASLAKHLGAFGEIRITKLEPEIAVAWEGAAARGTVRLEPSGWGTRVVLTAEPTSDPTGTIEVPAPELAPEPVARRVRRSRPGGPRPRGCRARRSDPSQPVRADAVAAAPALRGASARVRTRTRARAPTRARVGRRVAERPLPEPVAPAPPGSEDALNAALDSLGAGPSPPVLARLSALGRRPGAHQHIDSRAMREKAPETYDEKLAQLEELRQEAIHNAGQTAVDKQHAKGKFTARERIAKLLDPGSFQELDTFVRHRTLDFDMQSNRPYGDAVVTGHGTIDGRRVCVFSQDFTVFGGSLGEVMAEKMCKIMDLAAKIGCPVIGINDSGGARIQEGVVSLGAYGDVFLRNVRSSGVIPQISLVMGPCAGGAVYSPAITDFIFMVKETSHMFITGPDVIKTVTGEEVGFEELGGAMSHNSKSGVAHFAADDEDQCLEDARYLFSFLPQNNLEIPPRVIPTDDPLREDPELDTVVPDSPNKPYDMREVIRRIVDDGEFLEVHEHYARNIVCGLVPPGRLLGRHRRQPAGSAGRGAGHRVLGEGGALHPHLRRLQHPDHHLLRRARLPARHHAGVGRDHPPRRQAAVRLRRGDGPQDHDHHPQGLRRRL